MDAGSALYFPDPWPRFWVALGPRWPWGQMCRAPGAGADCVRDGPSLCSTCVSGEMVCTSEPCPGTPVLGTRESEVAGPQGPQGTLVPSEINLTGFLSGAPGK